jgi:hypothetical protein
MSSFYDDASLVVIPSGYKTSKIYAEKPTDGSGDLTFTRASGATRVASNGLIEKVRTNLITYSEQLNNAAWTKEQVTITANATTSPDGTINADKVIANATAGDKYIVQIFTVAVGDAFTTSAYFKSSEYTYAFIRFGGLVSNPYVIYNLATQSVVTTSGLTSSSITSVGNGWYRITATVTSTTTTIAPVLMVIPSTGYTLGADNIPEFTGDGTSGGFIWGGQLELSDFGATAYIPTTTAAVSVGPVSNVPRLDYLGSSCPRLLLEPQRTNLALYSEQFNNANWQKIRSAITANAATAPDGTLSADTFTDTTFTNSSSAIDTPIGATVSQAYTHSIFVKAGTAPFIYIGLYDIAPYVCILNASTGQIAFTTSGATSSVVSYGNGWYRISITITVAAVTIYPFFGVCQFFNTIDYSGTGAYTAQFWGAQVEAGAYATSYIPTLSASVTRVADALSLLTLPNSNMTFTAVLTMASNPIGGTADDWLRISAASILGRAYGYSASFGFADNYSVGTTAGRKIAWKQESGTTAKIFSNGSLVGTSTTGTYSSPFVQFIIRGEYLASPLRIESFLFFDAALPDAEIIELTTL